MLRTICFKKPLAVTVRRRQGRQGGMNSTGGSSVSVAAWSSRTVLSISVPVFWRLAKSCLPSKKGRAARMAPASRGPLRQTKGASRGGTKPFSCQKSYI